MELAPIIVFAYNRPDHYRQTLDALSQNYLGKDSILYLFCDGAKPDATSDVIQRIAMVRNIAYQQSWAKETYVIEADYNQGLANSIIAGVTKVVEQYDKVIVLEDDLITSPFFLTYMNKSLDFYRDNSGVFAIGGYNFPSSRVRIPDDYHWDNYVSLRVCTWGWATWKDRWDKVDWNTHEAIKCLANRNISYAFNRAGDDMTTWMQMQNAGKLDSWGIRFAWSMFKNHAITLMPCQTFVKNIGMDGSGVHCGKSVTDVVDNQLCLSNDYNFINVIVEDSRIINSFYSRFCTNKRPLYQRVINTIARKLNFNVPFIIKKRVYVED